MSFIQNNRYFIQNFERDTRNITKELKIAYYRKIKVKTRERMRKSYPVPGSDDSEVPLIEYCKYYKDLFEFFAEVEWEFLLMNLFFEPKFTQIVFWLKKNTKIFEGIYERSLEQFSFNWLYYFYFKEVNDDFFYKTFYDFLKRIITQYTSLKVNDLSLNFVNGRHILGLTHYYPQWISRNTIDLKKIKFFHFLLLKHLSLENPFSDHEFSCRLSIVFLNSMNSFMDAMFKYENYPRIDLFLDEIDQIIKNDLIADKFGKTPFEIESNPNFSDGYKAQRAKFLNKVGYCAEIHRDLLDESYYSLLTMTNYNRPALQRRIKSTISDKIRNFDYPNEEVLQSLVEKSNEHPQLHDFLKEKLYLYWM